MLLVLRNTIENTVSFELKSKRKIGIIFIYFCHSFLRKLVPQTSPQTEQQFTEKDSYKETYPQNIPATQAKNGA